ncbi:MAG: hypothetical protein QM703_29525 [Gemmatales bacterium]
MRRFFFMTCLGLTLFPFSVVRAQDPPKRTHSNIERLRLERLKATHDDVEALKNQRRTLLPLAGVNDFRCIMHAHAEDSTHTGGTLPEMLAQAKIAGVNAILLTDHFRPPRDFIDGRWRGMKEGVLFIPGSEIRGFLIYPMKSILDRMDLKTPEFVETVSVDDGMIFLSHIEERKDHSLAGLTGLEIYNRHYDAKRDMGSLIAVAMKLTDPKQLAELQDAVKTYPAELFAFQNDYPTVYLDKWDEGTKTKRLTGVAANDCHHNQVMVLKMLDEKTALLGTNVDEDKGMRKISTDLRPGIKELMKDHKPGDIIARVDVDPYAISFRNSATHILAKTLDEAAIRTALKAGHAYVSHDWMCDASGFQFTATDKAGKQLGVMGDEVKLADGTKLQAKLPVPALTRLLHHGKEVGRSEGKADVEFVLKEPGAYRLEAWLKLDGEYWPWIFANPIYVK